MAYSFKAVAAQSAAPYRSTYSFATPITLPNTGKVSSFKFETIVLIEESSVFERLYFTSAVPPVTF
ncbi:MAG: hypothetical protein ACLUG4_08840 [Bacilli bacterium]